MLGFKITRRKKVAGILGLSFLLPVMAGGYWLLAWLVMLSLYLMELILSKSKSQKIIDSLFLASSGLVLALLILVRTFLVDYYFIPSESMSPSLLPGDKILVSKIAYGIRLPKSISEVPMVNIVYKLLHKKEEQHTDGLTFFKRYSGPEQDIAHNDVIVFNNPQTMQVNVKRCVGLPGDTIQPNINRAILKNKISLNESTIDGLKNPDSPVAISQNAVFNWTIDKFGPLVIPGKGITIHLTTKNFPLYKKLIEDFELKSCFAKNEQIFLDGEPVNAYTFTQDYYFVLGDNKEHSNDSRHWGLVPHPLIIGKTIGVISSGKELKKI